MKFLWERMDILSLLLVFFSAVAVSRAQVQQETAAETSEGIGINITCSHPNLRSEESIHWYRQLPGRGPTFIASAVKGSKEVPDLEGRLWVSADRRSSAIWVARPRLGDAAVYYCAVGAQESKPGLRPGTNHLGRGGSAVPSGPAGGAACMAAKLHPDQACWMAFARGLSHTPTFSGGDISGYDLHLQDVWV
uniref:Ig-like domain-containing protein n=1 Tax=Meleagris gallopavo TaxID=9103 RepID=A0A803XXJ2_MELGA